MSDTTPINARGLTKDQKSRIKEFLRYGDLRRIANRCQTVGYRRASQIIRQGLDHDEVWTVTLQYLNDLPTVELDTYLAEFLTKNKGSKQ